MEREWETVKEETAKGENLFILRNSEMENSIRGNLLGKQLMRIPWRNRRVIQRGNHKDNSSLGGIGKGKFMGN